MVYVIIIILISTITGFLLTNFLDLKIVSKSGNSNSLPNLNKYSFDISFIERFVYGFVIGLGLFTWLVYIFSLFFGLQFYCIYLSLFILVLFSFIFIHYKGSVFGRKSLSLLIVLKDCFSLNKVSFSIHAVIFCFFSILFCRLFYRTIMWHNGDIYIGLMNNYGDLPLHLSYITSFVWGDNIPPQNPSYAGEVLSYPILSDFLSAVFLKLGLGFKNILFIPGFLLTTALYGILYYFVYRLTRNRIAALVATFIFFFSGGFGFYYFIQDASATTETFWHFITHLSRDYSMIKSLNYHWITPLSCLNIPQRAFLFGFPVTLLVFIVLYQGIECKKRGVKSWNIFLFAGIVAGLLPFFHTHSFMAMLMVTLPLALIFWDWRNWFFFFFPAFILSLPQIMMLSTNVGGTFFKYHFGWMSDTDNFFCFWLKNTGIFWPVFVGGVVAVFVFKKGIIFHNKEESNYFGKKQLSSIYFALTFLLLFLASNFFLFAPGTWDNIKILIYWFIGSLPIASIGLAILFESKRFKIFTRSLFFVIMFFLVFSGGIDLLRYAIAPIRGWQEFTSEEVALAKQIVEKTQPDAIFLIAPTFNHPVFLSGRKALMGYPGHIWSHGYTGWRKRERDIKTMLKGTSNAFDLIDKYKPNYVTVGRHERKIGVNKLFFDLNYESVLESDTYTVYDLGKRKDHKAVSNSISVQGGDQEGLSVAYFSNISWEGEVVNKEIFKDINFNWPNERVKPVKSPFSAIIEGYVDIKEAGTYTFKLVSDDGSWLYINDELVVDNGGFHASKEKSCSLTLGKGNHKIKIKYFDGGGGAVLRLSWIMPGNKVANSIKGLYF